jgi:iron complex outermembrane receptor protein
MSARTLAIRLLVPLLVAATSARAGRIHGIVVDARGGPSPQARVTIVETGATTLAADDGTFAIERVGAGACTPAAESPRHGSGIAEALLDREDAEVEVRLALDPLRQHETVVISATPDARGRDELVQAVGVLEDADLAREAASTLGETLARQPGVHSASFGPGAGRPVIRGLSGERVRLMTNGLEIGDASTASPDHAVGASPFGAERIEILRGPATLLYGSNAIGGAVNVIDDRIPSALPGVTVAGTAQLRGATVADEGAASLVLDGGKRGIAWHADGFRASAGDLDTPAGRLANTQSSSDGGAAGASWIGRRAWAGAAVGGFDTAYGSAAEEEVTIALRQRRLDVRGEIRDLSPSWRALRVGAGASDYEHAEIEGGETGTRFLNATHEVRVEALHGKPGVFSGSVGIQHVSRDFEAIGEESFVPPTTTRSLGIFAFEEIELDPWRVQLGARWDARDVGCDSCPSGSRRFDGLSASVGALRRWDNGWSVSASLSRSLRLPGAEELFSEGPHLATSTYERGDAELRPEIAHGLEAGVRHHGKRWHLEASAFVNEFDGFIRQAATGEVIDGLPVFEHAQGDARTWGGEAAAGIDLVHAEPHHVRLEIGADLVRTRRESGDALPRTPPGRLRLGLRYQGARSWALVQVAATADQRRVADLETPTKGFTQLEMSAGWRVIAGPTVHDVMIVGTNLTDELARNHASFLKDVAPLPGFGLSLTWRLLF